MFKLMLEVEVGGYKFQNYGLMIGFYLSMSMVELIELFNNFINCNCNIQIS